MSTAEPHQPLWTIVARRPVDQWTRTVEPFVLDLAYRDPLLRRRVVMGRLAEVNTQGGVTIPKESQSFVMDGRGLFPTREAAQIHLNINHKHM